MAEVVIIGGGVMGCSILYNLAERGVTDTVLLERDVLGSGSTGRSQAILRMHYSNEVTTRLAWDSLSIFRDFHEITGMPSGYTKTGYFVIVGPEDRDAMLENVAMQRGAGVDTSIVTAEDVEEIAPMVRTFDGESFAYEPESGYADPYSVTTGYANAAREKGAEIRSESPAVGIEVTGNRVTAVLTENERIETPIAVVAAGPWSGPLLASVGVEVPLRPIRHQVVMLRRPQDVVPDHPIIGDVVNDMSPRPDAGNLTLIGVGEDEDASPDTFNQGVDMPMVEATFEKLVQRMPGMAQALFRGGWSGLFTTTPDWHPVLDRVEGINGLYLSVGFSGHGFKLSPMIGVVMSELITQGRATSLDITEMSLDRFAEGRLMRSRYSMQVLA
ncbi:MAG: FAD-binding oxidoreductase [Dehalococcoidia bacterium]|nr:FAD-binding oxidoreductase [Dehalococcoidia bacterium]